MKVSDLIMIIVQGGNTMINVKQKGLDGRKQ